MASGFLNLFRGEPSNIKLSHGQVLFNKGDPAKHLYVVEKGQIDILDGDKVLETSWGRRHFRRNGGCRRRHSQRNG